jgi:hypothetical protein
MPKQHKLSFETTVFQSGNNTGIVVPDEIVEQLGRGKKPPVKVTINDYTYRNTVAVYGGQFMIGISADNRSKAKVKGGDTITVTLELDTEPREVALPADFEKALSKNTVAKKFFESLSYSNKRHYVLPIEEAKATETRQRRIEKALTDLAAGKKN